MTTYRHHGPEILPDGVRFHLWGPHLVAPHVRVGAADHPLARTGDGWWAADVRGARAGDRYAFVLEDGRALPDPAGRRLPDGVHGASQVWDPRAHAWKHGSPGVTRERLVFYELHVGTFTPEGTLDAVIPFLAELATLGVTCVELMPLHPFPGRRNWGYDGVAPYAVHEDYGGPDALQRLVDAAHGVGLAVSLNVFLNHLGPEGNYLGAFGPYFTERHRTPWGAGFDVDGPDAPAVRSYLIGAALQWVRDFRVDALRLEAVHAMGDGSARHIVGELVDAVHAAAAAERRPVHVIANGTQAEDGEVLAAPPTGWGCDAMWLDDLHHALRGLLTRDRRRDLAAFGDLSQVARALSEGVASREGESPLWGRPRGAGLSGVRPDRFVSYLQTHHQVGNQRGGARLSQLLPPAAQEAVTALLLLGPGLPLLFMGQEYGEGRPFLYFTSHGDPGLVEAVRAGRRAEMGLSPDGSFADPQDETTFSRCVLVHRRSGVHARLWYLHRDLLAVRRHHLATIARFWPTVDVDGRVFTIWRRGLVVTVNLGPEPAHGLPGWGWRIDQG